MFIGSSRFPMVSVSLFCTILNPAASQGREQDTGHREGSACARWDLMAQQIFILCSTIKVVFVVF